MSSTRSARAGGVRSLVMFGAIALVLGALALPAGASDEPSLTVTKTASSSVVVAGDVVSFTITVSNTGAVDATGVIINDLLPDSGNFWNESPDVGACELVNGPPDELTCNVGTLAAGASFTVTVETTTNPEDCDYALANTATVSVEPKATLYARASVLVTCEPEPPDDGEGCTLTQGFWKNHYPDAWPADVLASGLELGSVTYTANELADILNQPVKGNGLIALAHQLIAAKLNVASGADPSSVQADIAAADALIGGLVVPPVGSGFLEPSDASVLTGALAAFNEGVTGPGHCDDQADDEDGEGAW